MIIILHYKLKISNGMSLIFNVFLMKHKCLSDMLPTLSLNTAVAENFINILVRLLKYMYTCRYWSNIYTLLQNNKNYFKCSRRLF